MIAVLAFPWSVLGVALVAAIATLWIGWYT